MEKFLVYAVQESGDKVLVSEHATLEAAQAAAASVAQPSIEHVTPLGTTVLD